MDFQPKDLPGNDRYIIYPDGRIWDKRPRRRLPCFISQNTVEGYATVTIHKDGWKRTFWVHRLLAEAFLEKKEGQTLVRHLNDNRSDNSLENLKWGTYKENWEDKKRNGNGDGNKGTKNGNAKFTEIDIIDIRLVRKLGATYSAIAAAYGVRWDKISNICRAKSWKHVTEVL